MHLIHACIRMHTLAINYKILPRESLTAYHSTSLFFFFVHVYRIQALNFLFVLTDGRIVPLRGCQGALAHCNHSASVLSLASIARGTTLGHPGNYNNVLGN
jgi:hypothetical protein